MTNTSSTSATTAQTHLLEAAARLLSEEGPSALSARRIATEAGVSTMGLYTHFGSMANLVNAVVDEGFRRLFLELNAVGVGDDPVADIAGLTQAYLRHARANPHLYAVMFSSVPLGSFQPSTSEELKRGVHTLNMVADAMERAMTAGRFRPDTPFVVANQWWVTMHGYVLLEAAGYIRPPAGETRVLNPTLLHLFTGLGDAAGKAEQSLRMASTLAS